jgi:hypothetical protein
MADASSACANPGSRACQRTAAGDHWQWRVRCSSARGITPDFDQRITLSVQHILVFHNGPQPTCASIPNPPQHDYFKPDPELREFSVYYLTPHGVRSLVSFRLPLR